jgi:Mrp family chromosome partitioning ATPase
MTTIHRALSKAYHRDAEAPPAVDSLPAPPMRGWVSRLREPARKNCAADELIATVDPASAVAEEKETVAPRPAASSDCKPAVIVSVGPSTGSILRIDRSHSPAAAPAKIEAPAPQGAAHEMTPRGWSWPSIVRRLIESPVAPQLRQLAAHLQRLGVERDVRSLGFSGADRCAGQTSLLLTVAKVLVEQQSARVAIVDADFEQPGLAEMISLQPRAGRPERDSCLVQDALSVTPLVGGKLAIAPLAGHAPRTAVSRSRIETVQSLIRSLKRDYDLVLVDAGPWGPYRKSFAFEAGTIDAFVCVRRCHSAHSERMDDEMFRHPGIEWLGVIETFVPAAETDAAFAGSWQAAL